MQLGLYRTTLAEARLSSGFKVCRLGKMMNRGINLSPDGNPSNSLIDLTDAKEFPPLSNVIMAKQSKRRSRIDLHTLSKQKSEEVHKICPLQLEASTSIGHQNDTYLPTSFGNRRSSSPRNHKLRQTDPEHRGKNLSSKNQKLHETSSVPNQNDTDLSTGFGKSRSSSPRNHMLHQTDRETQCVLNQNNTDFPTNFGKNRSTSPRNHKFCQTNQEHRRKNLSSRNFKLQETYQEHRVVKRSSKSSLGTTISEPFDICLPETKEPSSKIYGTEETRRKRVAKVQSAEDNDENKDDRENNNIEKSVEQTGHVLRPGMVLFKHYLSLSEQADIVNRCRDLGLGPGGFYRPGYDDGAKLRLYMMCLGLDWNPQTKRYGERRLHDNAAPPVIPQEFTSLVCRVLNDSHTLIKRGLEAINIEDELPLMSPDVCIVNFYTTNGRLGLHQDRDESKKSLFEQLPVVSISVGDSAEFLYGDDRDVHNAKRVLLESGDVLTFGGESRHIFHGVKTIIPDTAPPAMLKSTNLKPGRLNLTFRKY